MDVQLSPLPLSVDINYFCSWLSGNSVNMWVKMPCREKGDGKI